MGSESQHAVTVLSQAEEAWRIFSRNNRGLYIPYWYSGLYGVGNHLLRQKCSRMCEKDRALSLIVRMNFILDHPTRFGVGPRLNLFCLAARKLCALIRSGGPIYDGTAYREIIPGAGRFNTSYTHAPLFEWRRTLACTLRNFVHLLWAVEIPESLELWQEEYRTKCGSAFE